jgi:pyruvate/2-oxoglutarate dehydrogenase complex dihydrolipoamide acyltransferase (E2) component
VRFLLVLAATFAADAAVAGTLEIAPVRTTEWKAVYGRVEARDTVPARARIGGIVVELVVSEGDSVKSGQKIAVVRDDKIAFQIAALDAQLRALQSQYETAQAELERGQALVDKGVITVQRLDQLRTQVDVARNQIASAQAQREVIVQQGAEGEVLAPSEGRILTVPVTRGAVIMAGEPIATIGGGGFFLRLAIPERHAALLEQDASIRITANGAESNGRLAKIYPQIQNGRVIADVLGIAGGLTRAFIGSPLTPLFLLAAFAFGLVALLTLPREEGAADLRADGRHPCAAPTASRPTMRSSWSPSRWRRSSRASTASSTSIRRPATTA